MKNFELIDGGLPLVELDRRYDDGWDATSPVLLPNGNIVTASHGVPYRLLLVKARPIPKCPDIPELPKAPAPHIVTIGASPGQGRGTICGGPAYMTIQAISAHGGRMWISTGEAKYERIEINQRYYVAKGHTAFLVCDKEPAASITFLVEPQAQ